MARNVGIGAILEVSYQGRHAAQKTLNVFHYGLTALTTGTTIDGDLVVAEMAADNLNSAAPGSFLETYMDAVSDDFELERIRFQWIYPQRFSFQEQTPAIPTGTYTSPSLPPNQSGVIGKRNIQTGRRNRGSIHMPAVPIGAVEDGYLTIAIQTVYALFGENARQAHSVGVGAASVTMTPLLYHVADPAQSQQWNEYVIMPEVRIMRRRTVGVGE
jgi:hypothetical protein